MKEYIVELGHIIGSIGQLIHHAANPLTLTAQHLTKNADESEPVPEGATSQVERTFQPEGNEVRADNHWEPEWEDRAQIGFRSNK